MNPTDFHVGALAWLAVVTALITPVIHIVFSIKKAWNDEKEKAEMQRKIALNQQQTEQNTARLNGQSGKIDTLMLQAPAPVVPVVIAAPETATAETSPQKC